MTSKRVKTKAGVDGEQSARTGPRCGSRVEWAFRVLKRVFGFTKVRCRGMKKSRTEIPRETGWADSASNLISSGGIPYGESPTIGTR
jgi:hypothetical protein